jgi:uncharacterized protein YuzE
MKDYRFTDYFENEVLRKRPYLRKEWCIQVVENPIRVESQEHNRFRYWGRVEGLQDRIPRVVTPCGPADGSQRFSRSGIQTMKLNYYRDTDSLYIDLISTPSAESKEISEGIVLDYDADGNLVGIDIDNASRKINLKEVILSKIPAEVEALTA